MFQIILLFSTDFKFKSGLCLAFLCVSLQVLAIVGTPLIEGLCQTLLSNGAMILATIVGGPWLCPLKLPPTPHRTPVNPFVVIGAVLWCPTLLNFLQSFGLTGWFGSGYGFVFLLVVLQCWLKDIYVAAEILRSSLAPRPPWPDPPMLIPFGYARRWCNLSFPHHNRRFGCVTTQHLNDFPEHTPFWLALLICFGSLCLICYGGLCKANELVFTKISALLDELECRACGHETSRPPCPKTTKASNIARHDDREDGVSDTPSHGTVPSTSVLCLKF